MFVNCTRAVTPTGPLARVALRKAWSSGLAAGRAALEPNAAMATTLAPIATATSEARSASRRGVESCLKILTVVLSSLLLRSLYPRPLRSL